MLMYVVTHLLRVPHGTVLYLSEVQARSRGYGLEARGENGWFTALSALCFKEGELLGFKQPPALLLLQHLALVHAEEERTSERDTCAAVFLPVGLPTLQAIAWQAAFDEGKLTIRRYQKLCRGIARRRLQRVLKKMVDNTILIREGKTHHACYRLATNNNRN
jgi:hypothetical protein